MMGKRIWSMMLAVLMVISMVPASVVTAYAADAKPQQSLSQAAEPAADTPAPQEDPDSPDNPREDPDAPAPAGEEDPVPAGEGQPISEEQDPAPEGGQGGQDPVPAEGDGEDDPAPEGEGDPVVLPGGEEGPDAPRPDGPADPGEQPEGLPAPAAQSAGVGTLGIFDWVRITFDSGYDGSKTVEWASLFGTITVPTYEEVFPTRIGYEFTGWKWYMWGIIPMTSQPGETIDLNLFSKTLTAQWKKAPVSVAIAASGETVTYDGTEHAITYTVDPPLPEGYTVGGVTGGAGTNVGTYPLNLAGAKVMKDGKDVSGIFDITRIAGSLVIEERQVTVTALGASKTYGEADPAFTFAVEPDAQYLRDDLGLSVTRSNPGVNDAGTYPGVLVPQYTADPNYRVTPVNGDFTINKAVNSTPLVLGNNTVTYDGNPHGITIVSGVGPEDTVAYGRSEDGPWNATPEVQRQVGSWTMYVRASRTGYEDRIASATLKIEAKTIYVDIQPASKVYGEADPEFTCVIRNPEDILPYHSGDKGPQVVIHRVYRDEVLGQGEDVGDDYLLRILATWSTNYYLEVAPVYLTITPRDLTIQTGSHSVYGDAGTTLESPEDDWVLPDGDTLRDGDTLSVRATGKQTGVGESLNTAEVAITRGGENVAGNYNLVVQEGTLEIKPLGTFDITVTGYEDIYDGQSHTIRVEGTQPGDTVTYSTDGEIWTETAPRATAVDDSTTVLVKVERPNHETVTEETYLSILPRPVTLVAQDAAKVYGQADPSFTYAVAPGSLDVVEGDREGLYSDLWIYRNGLQEDVGEYPGELVLYYYGENPNYRVTTQDGTLTITRSNLVITTSSRSIYGGGWSRLTSSDWTQTDGTLREGDTLTVSVTGLRVGVGTAPNTAQVTVTRPQEVLEPRALVEDDGEVRDVTANYNVIIREGTLTILAISSDDDDDDDDDDTTTIPDLPTPLGPGQGTIVILDGQVPLGALPKTGSQLSKAAGRAGLVTLILGSLLHGLGKKKQEEDTL